MAMTATRAIEWPAAGDAYWRAEPSLLVGLVLVAPLALLLGSLFVVPLVRVAWIALADPTFGLQHFREFFASAAARRSFATTLRVSALVTVLALAIGALVAWELRATRSRAGRLVLWAAVLFPLWTSIVVRMYALTIVLQREGILNSVLLAVRVIDRPLEILYTSTAVTIGILYAMIPYATLPLYASFVNIDEDLLRAAESLGASRARAFASVVIPLALPSVLAAGAIVFVIAAGYYITPIVLGGPSSSFLASRIDQQVFTLFDFPGGAATASILLLTALLIIGLAWRLVGFERIQRTVA